MIRGNKTWQTSLVQKTCIWREETKKVRGKNCRYCLKVRGKKCGFYLEIRGKKCNFAAVNRQESQSIHLKYRVMRRKIIGPGQGTILL